MSKLDNITNKAFQIGYREAWIQFMKAFIKFTQRKAQPLTR